MTLALQTSFISKANPSCFFLILSLLVSTSCKTSEEVKQNAYPIPSKEPAIETLVESGMWLMPQIEDSVLDYLQAKGMSLSSEQIYSTKNPSLSQAVVRIQVGDNTVGTGSFVSEKGLILTDQQSAMSAIAAASSLANNLLENGFYASSLSEEIPAKNYSLHIPIEQVDVTQKIEDQIPDDAGYNQKIRYQQQIRNQLIQERKYGNDNLLVEIKDIWAGNKQYMFVYKIINDVRLVHTPPANILQTPKFGKHSGHNPRYAFLRAYSADNKPYHPEKYLTIASEEPRSGDRVLTLNFPASTYKYENSYALDFYHNVLNPVLIKSQQSVLDALQYTAEQDSKKAIETAPQRYALTGNQNYYKNISTSFDQHNIINNKKEEEEKLKQWIKADSARAITYRKILEQLERSYSIASQSADLLYATLYPLNNNSLVKIAGTYAPYVKYLQNPDSLSFSETQKQQLLQNHSAVWSDINQEAQTAMLTEMIKTIATLPDGKIPFFLMDFFDPYQADSLNKNIHSFVDSLQANSIVFDPAKAKTFLEMPLEKARANPTDPFISFYNGLVETFTFARQNYLKHYAYAVPAQRRYVKALKEFRDDPLAFPDANATLRLSVGILKTPESSSKNDGGASSFTSTNNATIGSFGGPLLNIEGNLIGLTYHKKNAFLISDYLLEPYSGGVEHAPVQHILQIMREDFNADRLIQEMTKN